MANIVSDQDRKKFLEAFPEIDPKNFPTKADFTVFFKKSSWLILLRLQYRS